MDTASQDQSIQSNYILGDDSEASETIGEVSLNNNDSWTLLSEFHQLQEIPKKKINQRSSSFKYNIKSLKEKNSELFLNNSTDWILEHASCNPGQVANKCLYKQFILHQPEY